MTPEFAIRLTSTDDGYDRWEIMQRCIGEDYYVTLVGFDTLEEARAAVEDVSYTPERKEGRMKFLNARFGDDGKVWHLAAVAAVGVAAWVIIVGATIAVFNLIMGY